MRCVSKNSDESANLLELKIYNNHNNNSIVYYIYSARFNTCV